MQTMALCIGYTCVQAKVYCTVSRVKVIVGLMLFSQQNAQMQCIHFNVP